jgi:hypothetical protein
LPERLAREGNACQFLAQVVVQRLAQPPLPLEFGVGARPVPGGVSPGG